MDGLYPKIKYHLRGGGSILITSASQEKALGPEWVDNKQPSCVDPEVPAQDQPKKRGRPKQEEVVQ